MLSFPNVDVFSRGDWDSQALVPTTRSSATQKQAQLRSEFLLPGRVSAFVQRNYYWLFLE